MKLNYLNLKTMRNFKFYAMTALAVSMLASCSSDDDGGSTPAPVEDEEAITRVTLTFTNESDIDDIVTLDWNDDNGDEVVDMNEKVVTGSFSADQTYNATLELYNEDEDFLEEDITSTQAGTDAHFFVYGTDNSDFSMTRDTEDFLRSDNNKLGVYTTWTTGTTTTGSISVALYHESPSVSDSDGFGTAEGDDTDIDISFTLN